MVGDALGLTPLASMFLLGFLTGIAAVAIAALLNDSLRR